MGERKPDNQADSKTKLLNTMILFKWSISWPRKFPIEKKGDIHWEQISTSDHDDVLWLYLYFKGWSPI